MRLRFTIRDLLWLMVVAAILTCWWIDHRNLGRYVDMWTETPYSSVREELKALKAEMKQKEMELESLKNPMWRHAESRDDALPIVH